uniref:HDC03353 n=1 Tax=Drosophila melanogaster TaxID=7227 RepID=Q6IH46_DROME|nr:TPA_inf: HDC03353 [Drosophila melanogaster]
MELIFWVTEKLPLVLSTICMSFFSGLGQASTTIHRLKKSFWQQACLRRQVSRVIPRPWSTTKCSQCANNGNEMWPSGGIPLQVWHSLRCQGLVIWFRGTQQMEDEQPHWLMMAIMAMMVYL